MERPIEGIDVMRDETIEEPDNIRRLSENLTLDNDENDKNAKIYNTRALPKHAPTYELERFEKKALIIFNHKHFEDMKKPRLGTEEDVKALRSTFENFGFDVIEHSDLTKEKVLKELETFSMRNFRDYGCVAVAVLTHGKEDMLRAWDQAHYSEEEILQYFNVRDKPTLATKPRILIVQACRGEDPLVVVEVKPMIQADDDSDDENYCLPKEADHLILHSSYRGKPSFRHELEGSWFIQSLCKKINELADSHHLASIVTEVQREVAVDRKFEKFNRKTLKLEINKQMPVVTSTLMRKLYLRKHGDAAPQNSPLQSQLSTVFDHSSYTSSYLKFLEWMSSTETSLQSAKHSEEELLKLNLEVEEFRCVLDNMNLIGPQLFKTPIGKGNNKRFVAITERVKAISKKNIQENVDKIDVMFETKTSSNIDEIIENNLQELEKKVPKITNVKEVVQHLAEMTKLLSRLHDSCQSINKLVLIRDSDDRQTLETELANLRVVMRSFATYKSKLDTLNEAAEQILISIQGTKQTVEIVQTLDTLSYKCGVLQDEVRERQMEIAEAFKRCFHVEVEELLSWVSEVEGLIVTENPVGVGGLENATSSEALKRFMEIYAEIEVKRPIVEAVLNEGQKYISDNVSDLKVTNLKSRWDNVTTNAPIRKCKLETAVKKADEFREALHSFCDWFTKAEETLVSAQPASMVVENLDVQLNEHGSFEKDVQSHSDFLKDLDKRTYYLQIRDMNEFRKSLTSLQNRWDFFLEKISMRATALNNGYKAANKFRNMWNNLMNWLLDIEKQLNCINYEESIMERFDKRMNDIGEYPEFQKTLEAKRGVYNQVMETGADLVQKALEIDEPALQTMLSELKMKWELLNLKVTRSQHQTKLEAMIEVLQEYKREVAEISGHGDRLTVMALIHQHTTYEAELRMCETHVREILQTPNDLYTEMTSEDIQKQRNDLNDSWKDVLSLFRNKKGQLQESLEEAEHLTKLVDSLLKWLSEAEAEHKDGNEKRKQQLREDLKVKQMDKDYIVSLAQSLLDKAHPHAKPVIKQWIANIHSQWDKVSMKSGEKVEPKVTGESSFVADTVMSSMEKANIDMLKANIVKSIKIEKEMAEFNEHIDKIINHKENDVTSDEYKLKDEIQSINDEKEIKKIKEILAKEEMNSKSSQNDITVSDGISFPVLWRKDKLEDTFADTSHEDSNLVIEDHVLSSETAAADHKGNAIQEKAFREWINKNATKVRVNNVLVDFRDGKNLISLLEELSGQHIPISRGIKRTDSESNVQKAIWFLRFEESLDLDNITAQDIVDGDPRQTLDLIWTIIKHYQLHPTIQKELLNWACRSTAKYPEVNVTNFTSSWRDGLAFSALIHRNRPDLIDWSGIMSETIQNRLKMAFHTAETCGVTALLDPEDVDTEEPDDRPLIIYISMLHKMFPEPPEEHPMQRVVV